MVLAHTEASQSGVAAAAVAAGRWVIVTRVGGLVEQLGDSTKAFVCEPEASDLAATLRILLAKPPEAHAVIDPPPSWSNSVTTLAADLQRTLARPTLPRRR